MYDQYGRNIDYLRISVTDRCNLRCSYCMPDGVACIEHREILSYEEILKVCKVAVDLGIVNFKITGGEPLVRKGILTLIKQLKQMKGVKTVTLTTNGVLLEKYIKQIKDAEVDVINISLDTLDKLQYEKITGTDALEQVKSGVMASLQNGIHTRINCVLLEEYQKDIPALAELAEKYKIDIRFIELMPIGVGKDGGGFSQEKAREQLLERYPDLHKVEDYRGNGPARYEISSLLKGKIGWIDAISHIFCDDCNRVRLTSRGLLKPCLCYGECVDLKKVLRSEKSEENLKNVMYQAIYGKPKEHCFSEKNQISEHHKMAEIGG